MLLLPVGQTRALQRAPWEGAGAGEGRGRETRRSKKKNVVPAEEPETEIMEPKNSLIWN